MHVFYLDEDIFPIQIGNYLCFLAGISVCSTLVYCSGFLSSHRVLAAALAGDKTLVIF